MADTENYVREQERVLFGRRRIFTALDDLNKENVLAELNSALSYHNCNLIEEDYLYWYRRGVQPILGREKTRNNIVNNRVVENHADEIVAFKDGYFLTSPAYYVARSDDEAVVDRVNKLNEYLYRSGKHTADNKAVDWFHTVGVAPIFVKAHDDIEVPFKAYSLDPRSAFVVYSQNPGNKPVYGVNAVVTEDKKYAYDVWTKDYVYRLVGGEVPMNTTNRVIDYPTATQLIAVEENTLGEIPIIEYFYNSVCMGAFEGVISQLNALNTLASNRIDGVEQFIQSIAIAVNCEFDDGVTADKIREAGMICLKSTGENKADFRILSDELDQTQTQTLVNYIYEQVLRICSMPSTTKGGTSTSDTGAAVLARDGWVQANSSARNTEDLFKESNRQFDKIVLKILAEKGLLKGISENDFELKFNRNDTVNIQSKVQALQGALAAGVNPIIAFERSGFSNDAVGDVAMSKPYLNLRWGDPNEKATEQKTEVAENDGRAEGNSKQISVEI